MTSGLPGHLASLLNPQAYDHAVATIRLVETHISWVLLTGDFAYKIKRPVCYPFVDLSSADRRAYFCAEEVRLNRRFADELYLGVCEIRTDGGAARVGGRGVVIEHAVRMRQFAPGQELDRLLETSEVDLAELAQFGRSLAAIHERLPVAGATTDWGRTDAVRTLLIENLEQTARVARTLTTDARIADLRRPLEARMSMLEPWLAARRAAGRVRECHGDLHARNVVMYGGRLIAFDCMEFEPAFRWIDVADDVAFLLMDLDARRCPQHANSVLNGYLAEGGDYSCCRGLGLYRAHRALVRAKVAALEASQADDAGVRAAAAEQHVDYLSQAERALAAERPMLVLMHGLSGSGKSWLAERLAPLLGAVHLRSDVERKRLAGLGELASSGSKLQQGLYMPTMTSRVYDHLALCAREVLAGGYTAIVDATFRERSDRARFRELAIDCGVDLRLINCQAPREVLHARIDRRRRDGCDASEADRRVLEWQLANLDPLVSDEGLTVITADTTSGSVVTTVHDRCRVP